jgi:hypothetical protein
MGWCVVSMVAVCGATSGVRGVGESGYVWTELSMVKSDGM